MATTIAQLVADARQQVESLSPTDVAQERMRGAVLVDLREPGELVSGVIGGAVHAPRGMLEFYADPSSPYHRPELEPTRRTVLYCASGGRSALAAVALAELGYVDVAHLDGGFKAWVESGGPVAEHATVGE